MPGLNLDNYLQKIGINKQRLMELTKQQRLTAVYTAHLLAFPYNNVKLRQASWTHPLQRDIAFGDYKSDSFHSGYCFQLAMLLKVALRRLGFAVKVCEGRVLMGAEVNAKEIMGLPPNHLVLTVTIDQETYFLDPGLGSQTIRFPILVTGSETPIQQDTDWLKFYVKEQKQEQKQEEEQKLYVLERWLGSGHKHEWFTLIQTNLVPISQARINFLLAQLALHPIALGIREKKLVFGRILPHGRCSLSWISPEPVSSEDPSKKPLDGLKYVENIQGKQTEEIFQKDNFRAAGKLVREKFGIDITAAELMKYCTPNLDKAGFAFFNTKTRKAWVLDDFHCDEEARLVMQANLVPV